MEGNFTDSEIEFAAKVAKRLLGPPKPTGGEYKYVKALDSLRCGDIVAIDFAGNAIKCNWSDLPNGIAISNIEKGNTGWIQTKQ